MRRSSGTPRAYTGAEREKTPFDHVEFDSEVERRFAKGLDDNVNVKYFMKLPAWFTVDTPLVPYNPDWAIVFDGSERVYLVRETKGDARSRPAQRCREHQDQCARRHFEAIDVDYADVVSVSAMIEQLASTSQN